MKLLLHTCCAPCLSGSRGAFEDEGFETTALWYNPNIHPFTEYDRRLQTLERYLYLRPMECLMVRDYDLWPFMKGLLEKIPNMSGQGMEKVMSSEEQRKRCEYCYRLRFSRTIDLAKENGFEAFSTTLLLSPHQDHEMVRRVCSEASREKDLEFIYRDLRKNWKDSIAISRELRLYRQPYCGCIFSEQERFVDTTIGPKKDSTQDKDPDPGEQNG